MTGDSYLTDPGWYLAQWRATLACMSTREGAVTAFESALGREIRAQRARRGLAQSDITNTDAGLSLSSVQRIERGQGATTRQLLGLAAAFGMDLSEFMAAVEAEAKREPAPRRGARATTARRKTTPTGASRDESASIPSACQ